jgi:hypothetical protein
LHGAGRPTLTPAVHRGAHSFPAFRKRRSICFESCSSSRARTPEDEASALCWRCEAPIGEPDPLDLDVDIDG